MIFKKFILATLCILSLILLGSILVKTFPAPQGAGQTFSQAKHPQKHWWHPKILPSLQHKREAWDENLWKLTSETRLWPLMGRVAKRPFLVILVASAPGNERRRDAIRSVWGRRVMDHPVTLPLFLVGTSDVEEEDQLVQDESKVHQDILLGSYQDTYRNLTLKTVHGLRWIAEHLKPRYTLKTDDDCFVNVPILHDVLIAADFPLTVKVSKSTSSKTTSSGLNSLHTTPSQSIPDVFVEASSPLYVGDIRWDNTVVRDPDSRWYVSEQDFSAVQYPPYCSGAGYVLDAAALDVFAALVRHVHPFANEDAYVGTVLREAGVTPLQSARFASRSLSYRTCNLLYFVVLHGVSAVDQKSLAHTVRKARWQCRGEEIVLGWN